jgi:hypothetical protein
MSSSIICKLGQTLLKLSNTGRLDGEMRNVCKILVGKPEGKRPLGRLDSEGRKILKCTLG